MSNPQYDSNGNPMDPRDDFSQIDSDVRFVPQTRYNDIFDGKFPAQIAKDKDNARRGHAGGSSSAGGKGKKVTKPYDPVYRAHKENVKAKEAKDASVRR
ncbi:uncharacterized protein EAE97_005988 [Botrytis byssoidea]|uniref:Uncharacterized protein n=1 Tax=Botrytis byssoidea TaxID=139641 RepID=A0A9P5IJV6_9HELO|nr:uncharacterized protein EAE97_005988 [Botrytis byssoidea]KAF7943918.1 hypothetical protein EAE97_005988 [Botrytis byssoidea]